MELGDEKHMLAATVSIHADPVAFDAPPSCPMSPLERDAAAHAVRLPGGCERRVTALLSTLLFYTVILLWDLRAQKPHALRDGMRGDAVRDFRVAECIACEHR